MVEYDVFTKYLLGTQVPLGNQGLRHSVTRHFGTNFALSVCPKNGPSTICVDLDFAKFQYSMKKCH